MAKLDKIPPEQAIAALFEGKSRLEQMALLARLEFGGGSIYRAWAKSEKNEKARERLLKAADREDENGKLLALMSTYKTECEKCHKPLPSNADALACSFQCTFCPDCASSHQNVCPNCSGELSVRSPLL
jgi:uncharacterized protein